MIEILWALGGAAVATGLLRLYDHLQMKRTERLLEKYQVTRLGAVYAWPRTPEEEDEDR